MPVGPLDRASHCFATQQFFPLELSWQRHPRSAQRQGRSRAEVSAASVAAGLAVRQVPGGKRAASTARRCLSRNEAGRASRFAMRTFGSGISLPELGL